MRGRMIGYGLWLKWRQRGQREKLLGPMSLRPWQLQVIHASAMMPRQIARSFAATILAAANHRSLAAILRQSCSVSFRRAHSGCNHHLMATIHEKNLLGQ